VAPVSQLLLAMKGLLEVPDFKKIPCGEAPKPTQRRGIAVQALLFIHNEQNAIPARYRTSSGNCVFRTNSTGRSDSNQLHIPIQTSNRIRVTRRAIPADFGGLQFPEISNPKGIAGPGWAPGARRCILPGV
jgi:hypothetical protein